MAFYGLRYAFILFLIYEVECQTNAAEKQESAFTESVVPRVWNNVGDSADKPFALGPGGRSQSEKVRKSAFHYIAIGLIVTGVLGALILLGATYAYKKEKSSQVAVVKIDEKRMGGGKTTGHLVNRPIGREDSETSATEHNTARGEKSAPTTEDPAEVLTAEDNTDTGSEQSIASAALVYSNPHSMPITSINSNIRRSSSREALSAPGLQGQKPRHDGCHL